MISIIVAMDQNQLIGKQYSPNGLPWRNPEDLKHFKETTMNQTILMGLTTYQAIGRPLPNRKTIVVAFEHFDDERVEVRTSLEEVLAEYNDTNKQLYICGGASIYKQCLPHANELLISRMQGTFTGDAYFPDFSTYGYQLVDEKPFETFILQTYRRKS